MYKLRTITIDADARAPMAKTRCYFMDPLTL